jgi:hypothetical protein
MSAERRDVTTRALRAAVAAWFGIHPAELASLNGDTIDRMALRLEGRRTPRPPDAPDASAARPVGHPWAG